MKNLISKDNLKKAAKYLATAIATSILIALGISVTSCQATRTITTSAESYQRGDTSIIIQTKTIENYTATKKL